MISRKKIGNFFILPLLLCSATAWLAGPRLAAYGFAHPDSPIARAIETALYISNIKPRLPSGVLYPDQGLMAFGAYVLAFAIVTVLCLILYFSLDQDKRQYK